MRKHKLALAGVTLLAASLAMSACGSRAEQAPGGEAGAGQGRQDRRDRAIVGRSVGSGRRHQELGRSGHQAGQ